MRTTLSRRTLLRGLGGAALAVPLLESLQARAQTATPPRRLVIVYTPNGFNLPKWVPTGSGTNFQLSPILTPLAAFKSKLLLTFGTTYAAGLGYEGDGHAQGMQVMLSGKKNLSPSTDGFSSGPSVDQVIAQAVGNTTPLRSLALGVRTAEFQPSSWNRMSFYGSNQPVTPIDDPGQVFTSAFGSVMGGPTPDAGTGGGGPTPAQLEYTRRRSILDATLGDYQALRAKVGAADQLKLDHHLDSLRDVERRLQAPPAVPPPPPPAMMCTRPAAPANPGGQWYEQTANYAMVGQLQTRMLAAALACDVTRVATLQWSAAASNLPVSAMGLSFGGTWHDPTHTVSAANTQFTDLNVWSAQRFAELLAALDSYSESGGTVLDHTAVLWVSEDSGNHVREHICNVLAGSCGGFFKTGQYLNFDSAPRSQNDLYVSLCNAMGMAVNTFGDPALCRGALPGVAA